MPCFELGTLLFYASILELMFGVEQISECSMPPEHGPDETFTAAAAGGSSEATSPEVPVGLALGLADLPDLAMPRFTVAMTQGGRESEKNESEHSREQNPASVSTHRPPN